MSGWEGWWRERGWLRRTGREMDCLGTIRLRSGVWSEDPVERGTSIIPASRAMWSGFVLTLAAVSREIDAAHCRISSRERCQRSNGRDSDERTLCVIHKRINTTFGSRQCPRRSRAVFFIDSHFDPYITGISRGFIVSIPSIATVIWYHLEELPSA